MRPHRSPNRSASLAAGGLLVVNAFLLLVALPVLLLMEEGHAQQAAVTRPLVLVPAIGGVPRPGHMTFDPARLLRNALVEEMRRSSFAEPVAPERVDPLLPAGPYEPSLEKSLQVASELGAAEILRLRVDDHLRLDGGDYGVAVTLEHRRVAEGGRLLARFKSVRAFPAGHNPSQAARLEAIHLLGRLTAAAAAVQAGKPGSLLPEPTQLGALVPEVAPVSPTTYPEVGYTGTGVPSHARPHGQEAAHQTHLHGTRAPRLANERADRFGAGPPTVTPQTGRPIDPGPQEPTFLPPSPMPTPAAPPAASVPPSPIPVPTRAAVLPVATGAAAARPVPRPRAALSPDDGRHQIATLFFATSQHLLTPENQAILTTLGQKLSEFPDVPVLLEGHTDSRGATDENYVLSRQRAEAVRDALMRHGVDGERILAYGLSEDRPLTSGTSPEDLARNRRVEVFVLPPVDEGDAGTAEVPTPRVLRRPDAMGTPRAGTALPEFGGLAALGAAGIPGSAATAQPDAGLSSEQKRIRELLAQYRGETPAKQGAAMVAPSARAAAVSLDDDIVRPGDSLRVIVQGRSELTRTVGVDRDGSLRFPLIDRLEVAGRPVRQVETDLSKALETYVVKPEVQVSRIYEIKIFGQVTRQGKFQFDTPPTLTDLLARAEGVVPQPRQDPPVKGRIFGQLAARVIPALEGEARIYDLTHYLESGKGLEEVSLRHGETVVVEWNQAEEITVLGQINTTVLYRPGMRLLECLALAGGLENEEKQNIKNVRIFRRLGDGKVQRLEVNLHDLIHRGQVNRDVEVLPGDYVVVPRRSERWTALKIFTSLLQPVTQLGVLKTIF